MTYGIPNPGRGMQQPLPTTTEKQDLPKGPIFCDHCGGRCFVDGYGELLCQDCGRENVNYKVPKAGETPVERDLTDEDIEGLRTWHRDG